METTAVTVHRPTVGDQAPRISLTAVDGDLVEVSYADGAATVVVFTSNGCPYALAWHDRIQQLDTDYGDRGVHLVQVVSNDEHLQPKDSPKGMQERVSAGQVKGTYLRDAGQRVAAAFGATATPEVFVVGPDGVIRYHGAPDGDHDDSAQRARFVRDALDSLLADRPVDRPSTSPAGCSVKWRVELLWWDGCPSHDAAEDLLTSSLAQLGRADVRVEKVRVATQAQAEDLRFPGSPTLQVGGRDLFGVDADAALTCRVYTHPDGRVSPLPDREELMAVLADALARPWDLPGWTDFRKTSST